MHSHAGARERERETRNYPSRRKIDRMFFVRRFEMLIKFEDVKRIKNRGVSSNSFYLANIIKNIDFMLIK